MFVGLLERLNLISVFGILVAALYLYYISWIIYARYFHPFSDIPGPLLASFSRLWISASVAKGNAEHTQRALHRRLGHLVRIADNEVSVSDPEAVNIIYNVKNGFTKTDFYPTWAVNISPNGDNFSQVDEKKHAERRKFVNNVYSMSSILESEKYIDDCCHIFLEKMTRFAKNRKAIDFGQWIQWYTFDVVGELFFGHQFGFMRDEHDYGRFIETLDTLLPGIAVASVLPAWLRIFYSSAGSIFPSVQNSVKGFDEIRAAGRYWTNHRLEMRKSKSFERVDLLDKMFAIRDAKEGFDIQDIASEACVAIFAGSNTIAVAIRSIFYHLMKNRDCMSKLVAEIDDFDKRGELNRTSITYAQAIRMPCLVACCKEGMRLHPSLALGMPRNVPDSGATIAGRYFPPGTRVSINAAVLHYDQSVFGADADKFNPDRWLKDDAANFERYMLHFGGGTRTCIGKNVSLAEMHKFIPNFLRQFDAELVEPLKE